MPPFTPENKEPPKPDIPQIQSGMDQQTKNILLFGIIFSVLAIGIVAFMLLKPKETIERNGSTVPMYATSSIPNQNPTGVEAPKQSFWTNIIKKLIPSSLFSPPKISNMFGTPGPTKSTRSGSRGRSSVGTKNTDGKPYVSTTTESTSKDKPLTAEEQQKLYLKQLEGIYGEIEATEEQLRTIQLTILSSPLRGKLWISRVSRSKTDPTKEYITLSSNNTLPKETLLTGMSFKSISSGQVVNVGGGVNFPLPNENNYVQDIRVSPGQKITVISGRSPLGYSFRTNKCIGYFSQFQSFSPTLPQSCPRLKDEPKPEVPNQLSDKCLDYIDRVAMCRIVTSWASNVSQNDQEQDCRTFVEEHTGYQNCLRLHKYDSDFYGSDWRIYLNWTRPVWKEKREIIWLLDQSGRFISQYSY